MGIIKDVVLEEKWAKMMDSGLYKSQECWGLVTGLILSLCIFSKMSHCSVFSLQPVETIQTLGLEQLISINVRGNLDAASKLRTWVSAWT